MNDLIVKWMKERWLTEEQLKEANAVVYEDQIKFPVLSPSSRWVLDVIRNFSEDKPRYTIQPVNCRIGHTLFGYSTQKALIKSLRLVVVTEGIADSLAVRRFGIPSVAAHGAAISDVQQALLKATGAYVIVWGDGDEEGMTFAKSVSEFTGVVIQGYDPAAYLAHCDGSFPAHTDLTSMFLSERDYHYMIFNADGQLEEVKLRATDDREFD